MRPDDLSHCLRQFRQFSDTEVAKPQFEKRIRSCESCHHRSDIRCLKYSQACADFAKKESHWCKYWGEVSPAVHQIKEWQNKLKGKKSRLGICMPTMSMGGVCRGLLTMMNAPVKHGIVWSGIAINSSGAFDPETARSVLQHCPIYCTRDDPKFQGLVTVVENACQTVVDRSDVVKLWGYIHSNTEIDAVNWNSKPILIVAHGQCDWTRKNLAVSLSKGSMHILASVSSGGIKCFPDRIQNQVRVIYNGVDFSRCAPAVDRVKVRQAWGLDEGIKAVGYIGRFANDKNPLAAAKSVRELGADYHAVYIGEGYQQDQIIEDVKKLCGDRVTFIPRVEDIGTMLAALDCMVLASPSEGGPMTVIESWLAGCPVASTPVGMIPDLEAEHGLLTFEIPMDPSPEEIGVAVCKAIAGDERIERARRLAWERFSPTRMVLGYEALIRG